MIRIYALLGLLAALGAALWFSLHQAEKAGALAVKTEVAQTALKTTQADLAENTKADAKAAVRVRKAVDSARAATASARKALNETPATPAGSDADFERVFNDALAASADAVAAARSVSR